MRETKKSFDHDDESTGRTIDFIVCNKQSKMNTNTNMNFGDFQSIKTQGCGGSNSSRTKEDENDFNLSFDEDFFFEI